MPCYDPPPEWDGPARKNATDAAKILCAMVGGAPNYRLVPRPVLVWYYEHRKIDLMRAHDRRYTPDEGREQLVTSIEQDLAVIEHCLLEMQ